jgi:serine protease Do
MHINTRVFTVIALLAAAGTPVLSYAQDKEAKTAQEKIDDSAAAKAPKTSPIPPGAPATFADIAHDLLPAVVNISSTMKADAPMEEEQEGEMPDMPQFPPGSPFQDFFEEFMNKHGQGGGGGGEPAIPPASLGSGFVIDADKGYIVTNNHVVKDADEVRVTFGDDTTMEAKIIGKDEKMDLAVLQVKTDKKLTAVKFGDSDKMRVGDWVLAIGNPFGLGGTVTAGIVSAQQRDINAGPYDDFIQTDASINRGNSGGPMFDLQGDVIGINTAIFSPSGGSVGIGFAIPSNLAKSVVDQLVKYGKTRRGWIGVRIQSVTEEIAESLGLPDSHGALVASITEGGPAAKAKLKPGDVITEFDGKQVNAMRNLPRIVAETPIDKSVELKVWRDGKFTTAKIKVAELEKAEEDGLLDETAQAPETPEPSKGTSVDKVGMTVGSLSETTRQQFNIPEDVEGVVITKVDPKGEAAAKGLSSGDVVVEINQEKIGKPQDASSVIDKAAKSGKSSVLLLVNREGDVRFVALRLKKEK